MYHFLLPDARCILPSVLENPARVRVDPWPPP
jgi:hypothetical protein